MENSAFPTLPFISFLCSSNNWKRASNVLNVKNRYILWTTSLQHKKVNLLYCYSMVHHDE